ncbi:acyltransferase family protein [Dyadobacter luticola]|uniref:Acyltransferase n=1 Tax=Dyadobacter luticola TaxID=1979387 RepID=A0A5R9KPS1_9BACT|nr:acyltransferase [Dyadobacter luticola]TLU98222.1 acyltransferase [Dyadobacter luticola]
MLNSIQILRAIAALLVVFAHFEFVEPAVGGFGVDIFFVISGFIMAYIVNKNADAFLYRRIVRIMPLYYSMTAFVIALFLLKPSWFRNVIVTPGAIIKSLLFIPYRIKGSGPILSLGWTLNYEMFFYVSIAICLAVFGRKKGMLACLVTLTLFSILVMLLPLTNSLILFWGNSIILEFVAGSLLYYAWTKWLRNPGGMLRSVLIFLGLISFLTLVLMDHYYDPKPYRFLIFGVPSVFLAAGFLAMEPYINPKNKIHATMVLLGDASYAMYLVHPFVIYAMIRLVFVRFKLEGFGFELAELILSMIIVCLVSIALHKWFEKPVLKRLKLSLDKRFDAKKI